MNKVDATTPARQSEHAVLSSRQEVYQQLFTGTLIYSVALGLFNDYSSVLTISSYSTVVLAALVLQFMIFPTFKLKNWLVQWFAQRKGKYSKVGMAASVWAVMFFSKFVFLEIIEIVFGPAVEFSNFLGIMLVILTASLITQLNTLIMKQLR